MTFCGFLESDFYKVNHMIHFVLYVDIMVLNDDVNATCAARVACDASVF